MSNVPTAPAPATALDEITTTLNDFRDDCSAWQHEFDALLDELEAAIDVQPRQRDDADVTHQQLLDLDQSLCEQRVEFAQRQDELAEDLGGLRQLVDQQLKLFAAWINTTSYLSNSCQESSSASDPDALNEILDGILAQFEHSKAEVRTGNTAAAK